jgi:hypothetical protein
LYYLLDKLLLTAYNVSFSSIYGIFNFFFVSYRAASANETKGESIISSITSVGLYFMLNNKVHVAPIDLPHKTNFLYPHARK